MKKNTPIIIIAVVLLAAAIVMLLQNHYSTLEDYDTSFAVNDTASITKIFIADKNVHQLTLSRKGSSWVLDGEVEANPIVINTLLSTLKRIKVKAPVSLAAHDNVVKRMAGIGKKVEIYQNVYFVDLFGIQLFHHEKLTKVFYVGDATQNNLGTYMLMDGAERPYIVFLPNFRGFVSSRFSPNIDDWRSHIVFKKSLSDIKSLKIYFGENDSLGFQLTVKDAMGNYEIKRLLNGEVLKSYDTLKVLNLMTSFADLRYESHLNNLLPPQQIDSVIHSPSKYEITLLDNSGDTTFVKIFEKNRIPDEITQMYDNLVPVDLDRMYGLINGGDDFILLQYYVFDKVLHPISYYEQQ